MEEENLMEVVYINTDNIKEQQLQKEDCVMCLGYFDGVHLGHQEVISTAQKAAQEKNFKLAVLSFFPHPKSILNRNFENQYLEPLENRIEKLEKLGVDLFYIVEFNEKFSKIEAPDFIEEYVVGLGAKHIVCGFDYKFGHKAKGNVETLAQYSQRGIELSIITEQKFSENKISSTIIRECLESGEVHHIPDYMGSHYYTKYCKYKGTLSHYKLPLNGRYKTLIQTGMDAIHSFVTIDQSSKLHFDCSLQGIDQPLKIFWLEKVS